MILIYTILFILIQPVFEAVQNAFKPGWSSIVRIINPAIRIIIGAIWFFTCTSPTIYYVPTWQLIVGYILVCFALYDSIWNLTSIICGKKISIWYYGDTKTYDLVMAELDTFGWMMKAVSILVGGSMLLGWSA
ncbi:MAG TPA: hypothetical protein PL123_13875 [Bacteroidales bacterium]|nr:hypothetical protein [Bacteroidales bacterium]